MENELSKWEEDVKIQREEFYELNYFTTLQLLTLRMELGRLKDQSKTVAISPEILALLQSISTQVGPSQVINAVNQVLLEAKQEAVPEPEPEPEPVPAIEVHPNIPEGEQNDTAVAMPQLKQEGSTSPEPVSLEDSLSDELRGYITTISSRVDCSRQLVLKAFEILGEKLTRTEYEDWCVNNMDEYSFDDEASSDDSSSESEGELTADAPSEEEFHYTPGSMYNKQSLSAWIIRT